ncbi:aquaporin [Cristinia sonorae]|uniref:Aquaporin n=1 Tax=Cristinia sonorae TaxID=1940300 RepID=A0A8K0UEL4_9AGAR|nr:aquaporin [Cristinia sonorae]
MFSLVNTSGAIREPLAEFFGVMILVVFGCGTNIMVSTTSNTAVAASPKGDWLSINFGWGCATAMGIWVSGGISGGHINPAVTLAFAVFRDFPWRKVPAYIAAQVAGGFVGAGLVYANYIHAIDLVEGSRHIRTVPPESPGTAGYFGTYAAPYMSNGSALYDEFLGTMVLLICVCALTDTRNGPPPPGLVPLAIFLLILVIGIALGYQTGYAINPARDFGPRLFTAMMYSRKVFTFRRQYWLWCPILGTILGAQFGIFLYDTFIFTGNETIINRPNKAARAAHLHAMNTETRKPPAGTAVDP